MTLSSTHSEYCNIAKAGREAQWMRKVFTGMQYPEYVETIAIFTDSQGAIAWSNNPVQHEASKHVELADHYGRELLARGIISITFVSTSDMLADALTKALSEPIFNGFIRLFMADNPLQSNRPRP